MSRGVALRDRLNLLLCHHGLMRGQSSRGLEFADLFTLPMENMGPSPCTALVLIMDNGKTNQVNRREYAPMLRSKHVDVCPQGALAFYLFYRFHFLKEPFPSFNRNEDWFQMKVR
jgi:hypothetical protein